METKEKIVKPKATATPKPITPKPAKEDNKVIEALQKQIEELTRRDAEKEAQLKMLYNVADKGRIYNYESQRAEKKALKVKLSIFNDKVIVGWRTLKDELIKDSRTGATIGETQQYELALLDKAGNINNVTIDGYVNFSNARYTQRIEVEVVGRKEDWEGNQTFDVRLPDGRKVSLDSRFVN